VTRSVDEILEELKELGVSEGRLKPIRVWQRKRKKNATEVEQIAYECILRDEAFIVAAKWDEKLAHLETVEVCFRGANLLTQVPNLEVTISVRSKVMQDKWMPLVMAQ